MFTEKLLVIIGPTASGKTKLAVNIANCTNGEIISADSRQIFKNMDVGTGKDLAEYKINSKQIPYHLIDIKEAGEKYNVNLFKNDFYQSFTQIANKNKLPILCGGTGMYIHSILQNHNLTAIPKNEELRVKYQDLDKLALQNILKQYPENLWLHVDFSSAKRLLRAIEIADFLKSNELVNVKTPTINPLIIGLQSDVVSRRKRILDRLHFRLNNGLIEEVEQLLANGVSEEVLIFYGLEYKFVTAYLKHEINFATLQERLGTAICQFAKRQMTFFRKMEKDGVKINWLNAEDDFDELKSNAIQLINAKFELK